MFGLTKNLQVENTSTFNLTDLNSLFLDSMAVERYL